MDRLGRAKFRLRGRALILTLFLAFLVAVLFFPVEEGSRPLEYGVLEGKKTQFLALGGQGSSPVQHDVSSVWLGVGRAAPPGGDDPAWMLILEGRAFLDQRDRGPAASRALVDVESAIGLPEAARPAAVFSLPPGRPLALADLYGNLASRVTGAVFVLGVGELAGSSGWGKERGVLAGFIAPPGSLPAGGWDEHSSVWPGQGTGGVLWVDTPVPFSPVMTPREMAAAARHGCARTAPTTLEPDARFSAAVLYVWPSAGVRQTKETVVDPPLVDLGVFAPDIVLDIRYATPHNFTGQAVYPLARCFLARPVAERLVRVNRTVMRQGYRLKIFDGYRPTSAHWRLWELAENKDYLANPWSGSRHSRGAAVDLTLVSRDGRPVEMPTEFDTFSDRADRRAPMSEAARHHLEILTRAMVAEGFHPLPNEWWHFDYLDWASFPLRDIPLD